MQLHTSVKPQAFIHVWARQHHGYILLQSINHVSVVEKCEYKDVWYVNNLPWLKSLVIFHMPFYKLMLQLKSSQMVLPLPSGRERERESCINVYSRIMLELKRESKDILPRYPLRWGNRKLYGYYSLQFTTWHSASLSPLNGKPESHVFLWSPMLCQSTSILWAEFSGGREEERGQERRECFVAATFFAPNSRIEGKRQCAMMKFKVYL